MSTERPPVSPGSVADDVRTWLAENFAGVNDREWREHVIAAGWAAPTWPADAFGRNLSSADATIVREEFRAAGAKGANIERRGFPALAGNTIVEFGSPAMKNDVLPKLLSGEWGIGCLLYSEPSNGSDLAGLQTRAVRDGDDFIVNGQKIWTTSGHEADCALLLARTDWDQPKHAGISFFIIPMDLPGIEVRPIKQMTGESDFNEVFLDNVRVPASALIGELNDGWRVLQTALKEERRTMGFVLGAKERRPEDRPAIFTDADDLIAAAREAGRLDDEAVRQEIMRIHTWRLVNDWNSVRAKKEIAAGGGSSLASLGKLAKSRILHSSWALRFRLLGARGLMYDEAADKAAYEVDHELMWSFINSIGGGTDQIQRNIIGERILGLPKGHEPDRGVPFRDIRKGGTLAAEGK
ncbi:acyl-CoA dehydrogenase family protein [Gordonia humi]|uniref:Alkylation response protein AidB-like acyl-CoA dehydrogenase n=1 Tax=Gordonia humi TaxID=686429 RepID=A0A840EVH0_9ACTN|nr:acyl-CoA dehydrogenase family protein [Gordonia humi]MBB4133836.1 alkylation response protein AidB-like acyl-CoA dehydrogenase [Gordonia humi]